MYLAAGHMGPALRVYGADRVVRPYKAEQEPCEAGRRGRRPDEEVYGDTAVRCGRNQLGGGA